MSLDFDGVDDEVAFASGVLGTSTVTVACWFSADAQGENDGGNLIQQNGSAAASPRIGLQWNGTPNSKKLRWFQDRTGTPGTWDMTTGFTNVTGAKWVAVTYDMSSTANDPTMYTYEDGVFSTLTVGSGLTEVATPSGTLAADTATIHAGNNSNTTRTFDGRLAEVAIWTSLLSANAISAVFELGVLSASGGADTLYLYWPFDDTGAAQAKDLSGNARHGTITGAVVGPNPSVRPAGRRG